MFNYATDCFRVQIAGPKEPVPWGHGASKQLVVKACTVLHVAHVACGPEVMWLPVHSENGQCCPKMLCMVLVLDRCRHILICAC